MCGFNTDGCLEQDLRLHKHTGSWCWCSVSQKWSQKQIKTEKKLATHAISSRRLLHLPFHKVTVYSLENNRWCLFNCSCASTTPACRAACVARKSDRNQCSPADSSKGAKVWLAGDKTQQSKLPLVSVQRSLASTTPPSSLSPSLFISWQFVYSLAFTPTHKERDSDVSAADSN